ncbi:MAG: DEAD/DEAH box helicase [Polyangiaceae bacterium]
MGPATAAKVDTCASSAAAIALAEVGPTTTASADVPDTKDAPPRAEPRPAAFARIAYRLSVDKTALRIDRAFVLPDGGERRFDLSLTDRIARGMKDPPMQPTHDDLAVDRVMGRRVNGDVLFAEIPRVLAALASSELVTFEGAPTRTTGELVGAEASVVDAPNGAVELVVRAHRSVQRVVAMGVAMTSNGLAPLDTSLGYGLSFERLPERRAWKRDRTPELVSDVLPALEKKGVPVEILTKRLPQRARRAQLGPRLSFDLTVEASSLLVMPLVVYGDPAIARVDAGKLVLLSTARGATVPTRNEVAERDLVDRLRDELSLVPGRRVRFDGRDAARFAARLEKFQSNAAGDDEAPKVALAARLVESEGAWDVVFEGDTEGGETRRASAEVALWAHREGLDIVPLEGGGFGRLPAGFLAKHAHKVADLLAARGEGPKAVRAALPVVGELADALGAPRPRDLDALSALVDGFTAVPKFVPSSLEATLRPYQEDGVSWLMFMRRAKLGALLADDMGLGKTVQTIAVLPDATEGATLVVCPRSVVHNWVHEIARFRPSLRVVAHDSRDNAYERADVVVTTYALLRMDHARRSDGAWVGITGRKWGAVVLDEAQAIKNADSMTARASFALEADFRVALSGTPVENRLEELHALMRFLNPGVLGTRAHFKATYVDAIESGDAAASTRLRTRMRPFLLRRKKGDVALDLPPLSEAVEYAELEEDERAVYDAVRAATRKDIVEKLSSGGSVLAALEALLRLRQAACHCGLVPGQSRATSTKVERLVEMLAEAHEEGHRALVFSQWTGLLDRIEPHLDAARIAFERLDGSTRDREGVVRRFQAPDGPPVMLVSLKAGGAGLNLTAADHVFIMDPWWNPAVEQQAEARAHRIGQERPVVVHRIIAKDTVEERILALQEKKRRLADVAVGDGGAGASITRDDLLALLE